MDRLAFGSVGLTLDIGDEENDEAKLFARSSLVVAWPFGSLPPPRDGVAVSTTADLESRAAATPAQSLGFGGKRCIHPRQVDPVIEGFRPPAAQLAWATCVLEAAGGAVARATDCGAISVDGHTVDRPVLAGAQSIVSRAGSGAPE